MWHYFWGHVTYHLMHFNGLHIRKYLLTPILIILGIISAGPPLFVIAFQDLYIMHCPYPFSTLMLVSLVLTFFMLVFVVMFSVSEDVALMVKMLFHVFGIADAIFGVIYIYYVYAAFVCAISAKEVYFVVAIFGVFTAITYVFFIFLFPCWIKDWWLMVRGRDKKDFPFTSHAYCKSWSKTASLIPCFKPVV